MADGDVKKFTRKEVAEKNNKRDAVFIIDNVVYDVTKFLDEHPGGHEVLVNVVGKDASEDFEDVSHSIDAKELMRKFVIGELVEEDKRPVQKRQIKWDEPAATGDGGLLSSWKLPLVLGILVTFIYSYLFA